MWSWFFPLTPGESLRVPFGRIEVYSGYNVPFRLRARIASDHLPLAADVTAIPLLTERMPSLDVSPLFKKSPGQATSGTTSMLMEWVVITGPSIMCLPGFVSGCILGETLHPVDHQIFCRI
jgi:hypothetical protein